MPDWFLPLAGFISMIVTPVLAWWGSSRYFAGRFDEQSKNTGEWRNNVEKRLEHIDKTLASNSYAAILVRVQHIEDDQVGIHRWKHNVVDPYVPRAIEDHERRLNQIENRHFRAVMKKDSDEDT